MIGGLPPRLIQLKFSIVLSTRASTGALAILSPAVTHILIR
jgi:hypothetical protein